MTPAQWLILALIMVAGLTAIWWWARRDSRRFDQHVNEAMDLGNDLCFEDRHPCGKTRRVPYVAGVVADEAAEYLARRQAGRA